MNYHFYTFQPRNLTYLVAIPRGDDPYPYWIRTCLGHLDDLIRGEVSLSELAERILTYTVNYTGAQLGAFYTLLDQRGFLQRTSTYSFNPEDNIKVQVPLNRLSSS